jgi:hypothetical protein
MKHTFKNLLLFAFLLTGSAVNAQGPEVTSWILNLTGQTGYGGILSNVQQVQYSTNNVYVTATCIPDYSIGPWTNNPNTPVNQNFLYKITRNPVQNLGTLVSTPMGHIGVWSNGVSVFNARDGMSYNNMGIWNRDAFVFEGISFDNCLGHPAPNGEYHNHINPTCLYDDTDNSVHAPIIGYAFDGFPIYGAYGYDNPNGTGIFRKMETSYQLRNITSRTTLPDGTILSASQYGPAIGAQYPLGSFLEDYEYIAGSGDLDEHNGRFCVTPDYPNGIYAYFVTIDVNEDPLYPYVIGPTYYGTVQAGNTGPGSGHNTISEPVTNYIPGSTGVAEPSANSQLIIYAQGESIPPLFSLSGNQIENATALLMDCSGRIVNTITGIQSGVNYPVAANETSKGIYILEVRSGMNVFSTRICF